MFVARLLLLACMAFVVGGCSFKFSIGGDPAVEDVVLSTEIDRQTSAPRNNFEAFPAGVRAIYATVEIHDLDAGEEFTFRWLKGEEVGREVDFTLDKNIRQGWVYSSLELPEGLDSGDDYEIEVYRNGKLETSKQFDVNE